MIGKLLIACYPIALIVYPLAYAAALGVALWRF
jgi:hypothetical protein